MWSPAVQTMSVAFFHIPVNSALKLFIPNFAVEIFPIYLELKTSLGLDGKLMEQANTGLSG